MQLRPTGLVIAFHVAVVSGQMHFPEGAVGKLVVQWRSQMFAVLGWGGSCENCDMDAIELCT
jgi:hypothetical protein